MPASKKGVQIEMWWCWIAELMIFQLDYSISLILVSILYFRNKGFKYAKMAFFAYFLLALDFVAVQVCDKFRRLEKVKTYRTQIRWKKKEKGTSALTSMNKTSLF